jgi:hypothetical protein
VFTKSPLIESFSSRREIGLEKSIAPASVSVLVSSIAMVLFSTVTSYGADDPYLNNGGCTKCVGLSNQQKNVYDGKTTRFQGQQAATVQTAARPTAVKTATEQPAAAKP